MSRRFHDSYGARPLHLLSGMAALALSGYAILELFHRAKPVEIVEWLVAAIVIHDLILLPVYSLLGGLAHRGLRVGTPGRDGRREALNHLRIAAFFVALPLFIWAPLIFGLGDHLYRLDTGLRTDAYLGRWLLYSGVVCVGSALLLALRVRRAAPGPGADPAPRRVDPRGTADLGPAPPDLGLPPGA